MVGLLKPTSGKVLINGTDVHKIEKGTIGICPQELMLWEYLTCKESLNPYGRHVRSTKKSTGSKG